MNAKSYTGMTVTARALYTTLNLMSINNNKNKNKVTVTHFN